MSDEFLTTETLDRLSRQDGVDTRPILVRVLTDLFVQKQPHAPQEIARYQELVMGLIDTVGVDARAAVARKLADAPDAPEVLIARLIADDVLVSAPILARSTLVSPTVLMALALDGGPAEAAAISSRADLDDDLIALLVRREEELVLEALAVNAKARFGEAALAALVGRARRLPAVAAALLLREDVDPTALAPLYLGAEPSRRVDVRGALAARTGRPQAFARPSGDADALDRAIDAVAAAIGEPDLIVAALSAALDLPGSEAGALAAEESGEAFVLMLRAAGLADEQAIRAALVFRPDIAISVPRFFALVEVIETTTRSVAAELVRALVGREAHTPRHEPAFEPQGTMERGGAARPAKPARRAAARRETANQRR